MTVLCVCVLACVHSFVCSFSDDFQTLNSSSHDQESHDLIKSGLLTPFGTTSSDKGIGSAAISRPNLPREDTPSISLADFNWLGLEEQSTVATTAAAVSSSSNADKGKGKGPGKLKVNYKSESPSSDSTPHSGSAASSNWNGNGRMNMDNEYVPGKESGDDDLSEESLLQLASGRRKRRKPRPLANKEDSEEEMVHLNWTKGNKRRKGGCGQDDGDIRLYKERIRWVETFSGWSHN